MKLSLAMLAIAAMVACGETPAKEEEKAAEPVVEAPAAPATPATVVDF